MSDEETSWRSWLREMAREESRHVTSTTGVPFEALVGRERSRTVARARQLLVLALRDRGLSTPEIGMALDRDHTTILHYLNVMRTRVA